MKIILVILMILGLLSGCGSEPAWETVEDPVPVEPVAVMQQLYVDIPQEAAAATFQENDRSQMYLCQDYTLTTQILDSGDLAKTVKNICGQDKENLQILQTQQDTWQRYEFVWTAAGEDGLQLGRACILDDGAYHYAVSAMASEENSGKLRQTWQDIFDSCRLIDPEVNLSTGS